MLHSPHVGVSSDNTFSLMGIDPGSETMGIAIMKIDIETLQIKNTTAFTSYGSRMRGNFWLEEQFGERARRIDNHRQALLNLFRQVQPLSIAVEAPFFNHFRPQAFSVLMEVMGGIERAIYEYDPWQVPYKIDPSSVKNAVGAPGNAKKEVVQAKVMSLAELNPLVNLAILDEHSIDAIAVVYTRYKRLLQGN